MTYTVEILRVAQKQLAGIAHHEQPRIEAALRGLATDPRPPGCKKLTGRPGWRIRIGRYRVVYEIRDDRLLVLVVAVGHRKEIYR